MAEREERGGRKEGREQGRNGGREPDVSTATLDVTKSMVVFLSDPANTSGLFSAELQKKYVRRTGSYNALCQPVCGCLSGPAHCSRVITMVCKHFPISSAAHAL